MWIIRGIRLLGRQTLGHCCQLCDFEFCSYRFFGPPYLASLTIAFSIHLIPRFVYLGFLRAAEKAFSRRKQTIAKFRVLSCDGFFGSFLICVSGVFFGERAWCKTVATQNLTANFLDYMCIFRCWSQKFLSLAKAMFVRDSVKVVMHMPGYLILSIYIRGNSFLFIHQEQQWIHFVLSVIFMT